MKVEMGKGRAVAGVPIVVITVVRASSIIEIQKGN